MSGSDARREYCRNRTGRIFLNTYAQVRILLRDFASTPTELTQSWWIDTPDEFAKWQSMWTVVAGRLLQFLDAGNVREFEAAFRSVGAALEICEPIGRQAANTALFGDFTRRAILAGFDRTRFVEWFVPKALFAAPSGRQRGRVLYFDPLKGRGKVLGADRTVYLLTFGMLRGPGFRSVTGGQFVQFTPQFGSFNGREGWAASNAVRLSEADGTELQRER